MPDNDADPVAAGLPPMPRPSPQSLGDLPLQSGSNSTLGIKLRSRGKGFYFLAARGALRRYGRRFPLTEEGWAEAWTAFAGEDPAGAARYLASLDPGSAAPAPSAGTVGRRDALDDDGWLWVLLGGIGWLGGAALVYEGIRHVTGAMVLIGAALLFAGLVAALYGVAIEGIRLARRTS